MKSAPPAPRAYYAWCWTCGRLDPLPRLDLTPRRREPVARLSDRCTCGWIYTRTIALVVP